MKRQFTKWVKIFAKHTSDKVCIKKPLYMLERQRGCMALEWRTVTARRLSCGCMALEPGATQGRYPTSKVRSCGPRGDTPSSKSGASGHEDIPHVQGKEHRVCFAGASLKRYPTSKVRETPVRQ